MKKSLIIASIFATTAFTASTFAFAEEEEQITPITDNVSFQILDANQDGVISIEEAEINEILINVFADLDQDKSDDLSEEEFSQFSALVK